MVIDGDALIERHRNADTTTPVEFADGRSTLLTPRRCLPMLDDADTRLELAGDWQVRRWPFPKGGEAKLARPATKDGNWETAPQPGPIFAYDLDYNPADHPEWKRVTMDHIDPKDGAMLRRTVRVPSAWKDKRILLTFEAVYPAARFYVNGVDLGEHLSGLTPIQFDVTEHVKPGRDAVIAVRLLRTHKFVQLDMPRHACEFAGISQPAHLHAVDPVHLAEYQLIPELDKKLRKGTVEGTVAVANTTNRVAERRVKVELLGPDGKRAAQQTKSLRIPAGEAKEATLALSVARPLLWNDEHPHLYTVRLTLAGPGKTEQTVTYRTAFRRLDLSPKGPRLNGNPVKFRGVNHLTWNPQTGMYTPKEWLRRNLEMMKKANVNAIRTHFLGPRALAELCDEMGMYLLQELPIDWGTDYIDNPEWMGPILMRLESGVRRDRHHPSIMVWSVGNENMPATEERAPDGWNHLQICERFVRRLDPSRAQMFPPPGPANKVEAILELRLGDVADTHYSFKHVKRLHEEGQVELPNAWDGSMQPPVTAKEARKRGWKGVWFSSEYGIFNMIPDLLNAPYNSIISDEKEEILSFRNTLQVFQDRLKREWGQMRDDPTCLGGAYFPWICGGWGGGGEGNPWGWVRWAEDADWGPITADLTPKPFYWALRVLFSPVWIDERSVTWKEGDKSIAVTIHNQYNDINLQDCTLRTMMGGGGGYMTMMRAWKDVKVTCRPGQAKTLRIPVWNKQTRNALSGGNPAICRCIFLDPEGFRPLTQDIVIVPEKLKKDYAPIPIGPDAILD